ncbi:MAG: ribosome biogenesis GTPase YlqF [Clostridiales bacterium]|jgi:ribosome biogenesis GTPase A|nr:ribosome biogenesis GTPase YlqF [Clostridiales bacterium]
MNIQWFPGHMAKARRMMAENVKLVDIVCEIIDARIPISSSNPDIPKIIGTKPRLLILNRIDLADPGVTRQWRAYFKKRAIPVLETDAKSGRGVSGFSAAVREIMKEKLQKYAAKGIATKVLRAMVVGIPNVGKSTFINKVAKRKAAAASDRPGVTRGKQWITVDRSLELLDTPGLLWPKLEGPETGVNLAFTGAVKDDVIDIQELAARLMQRLSQDYPELLAERYKLEIPENATGYQLLEMAAGKRGFLISGGQVDTLRMSAILLDEFRGGKIGRISLEKPGDYDA